MDILGLPETDLEYKQYYENNAEYMELLEQLANKKEITKDEFDMQQGYIIPNLMWEVFIEKEFIKLKEGELYTVNSKKIEEYYKETIQKYNGYYSLNMNDELLELLLGYEKMTPGNLARKLNVIYYEALEYIEILKEEKIVSETEDFMVCKINKKEAEKTLEQVKKDIGTILITLFEKISEKNSGKIPIKWAIEKIEQNSSVESVVASFKEADFVNRLFLCDRLEIPYDYLDSFVEDCIQKNFLTQTSRHNILKVNKETIDEYLKDKKIEKIDKYKPEKVENTISVGKYNILKKLLDVDYITISLINLMFLLEYKETMDLIEWLILNNFIAEEENGKYKVLKGNIINSLDSYKKELQEKMQKDETLHKIITNLKVQENFNLEDFCKQYQNERGKSKNYNILYWEANQLIKVLIKNGIVERDLEKYSRFRTNGDRF